MSKNSSKGYKFTIQDGAVTAIYEIKNGKIKQKEMDRDETWSLDGNQVVKTEHDDGRLETTVYADIDGDGVYAKVSEASGPTTAGPAPQRDHQEGYKFAVQNGVVTAVYEVKNGTQRLESIDRDESWSIQGADFVKTEREHGVMETSVYSDTDGDGIYIRASRSYASNDGTATVSWDEKHHGDDADDHWNGSRTDDHYFGGLGNDALGGNEGDDDLYGAEGSDHLSGGTGADDLYGGDGDDVLQGGRNKDLLVGDTGNDIFKFTAISDSGSDAASRDVIADFSVGDRIDLSMIDAMAGNRTNDAFKFIGSAVALTTKNANGALWFENGVLYGSNDKDLAAEFQIELTGVTALTAESFML